MQFIVFVDELRQLFLELSYFDHKVYVLLRINDPLQLNKPFRFDPLRRQFLPEELM